MGPTENAELYQSHQCLDSEGDHPQDAIEDDKTLFLKINWELIPAKLFYFFYFSSLGALLPYLALYYKQMKLTPSQVGVLMGLKPFVEFICAPLWGAFVDRFQKGRPVLLTSLLVAALSQFSLSLVAPAERLCTMHLISRSTNQHGNYSSIGRQERNVSVFWSDFTFVSSVVNSKPWPLVYLSEEQTSYQPLKLRSAANTTELFTILFIIILVSNVISSPSLALADTVTMQTLKPNEHLYGRQRLWGSVGWGLASFLVGALVTLSHHCPNPFTKPSEINYTPCFCVFGALMLLAVLISMKFTFSYNTGGTNSANNQSVIDSFKASISTKYVMFLFTAFYFGILNAFTKTFLFWHLKDLGGSQLLFSVIAAVNCFSEVSIYIISDRLITRLGHARVIYFASAGFALRCLWYAFVTNPWLVLPVEVIPGLTNALAWVAMLSYVNEISTSDNSTTHQGILYGFYRGLGYGCGEVLGGVMINVVGSRNAFKVFALGATCTLVGNIFVENLNELKRFLLFDQLKHHQQQGQVKYSKLASP